MAIPKGRADNGKDLDLAIVVRGTRRPRLSIKRRGRRDEAEIRGRMVSLRYLSATPSWALRTRRNKEYFLFNASRNWICSLM